MTHPRLLFPPGTEEYAHGTSPLNSSADQHPGFVAVPGTAADVGEIVTDAAARGLVVMAQATGHGASGAVDDKTIIVDTSSLDDLRIDAGSRTASAGAGQTWGAVNAQAERHGLLGLAGSAPGVSISGFTFGGGLGWLTRPHGMASSALRGVEYVDGAGEVRRAAEDAAEVVDRDALWAFRGGDGVGIATGLEFDLVPVPELWAGYLLWSVDELAPVVGAWAAAMARVGDGVSSSIAVLHAPPAAPIPEPLQGRPVLHLAVAASTGAAGVQPLLELVRAAAAPVADTWGPADAARLAGIHLDPPVAVPAIGAARWLGEGTPAVATGVLAVAAADDSSLTLVEIRHFANAAAARPGAETSVPGPFVVHAVGALGGPGTRGPIEASLARVRAASASADLGRSVGSWIDGAESSPDALPAADRDRLRAITAAVDPRGVIRRSRYLA